MAYQPAGNLTGTATLGHLATVYYNKRALDRLQKKFRFHEACTHDMVPKQSGRTVQFFRYSNFAAATTPTTEGTVGTSQSLTSKLVSATVSQYTSFITVSDFLVDTAIDPIISAAADLLGYQGGLTVDTITRNVIDAESASTNMTLQSSASIMKVADLRNARHTLQALDVRPFANNQFFAIAHPYVTYDIVNDPAAGGLGDIFKYTSPGSTPLVKYEDRGTVTEVAGCRLVESTNVKQGTSGSSNTYRAYVFGDQGVGCVDLQGRGPAQVTDPRKERFTITAKKNVEPSIADPEGVIGGFVSYNFVYTAVVLDGPAGIGGTYRYRTFDPISSIG